jgi:hypothetical protein
MDSGAPASSAAPAAALDTSVASAANTSGAARHGTVIKSMVERFRYGSPLSRGERAKLRDAGNASEFWWKKEGGVPPPGSASASANVSLSEAGGAQNAGPAPGASSSSAPTGGTPFVDANNVSFASFMPDTQPAPSYRYGGGSSMPSTPATAGRPVMDA